MGREGSAVWVGRRGTRGKRVDSVYHLSQTPCSDEVAVPQMSVSSGRKSTVIPHRTSCCKSLSPDQRAASVKSTNVMRLVST